MTFLYPMKTLFLKLYYVLYIAPSWNGVEFLLIVSKKLFLSERDTRRRFEIVTFLEEQKREHVEITC